MLRATTHSSLPAEVFRCSRSDGFVPATAPTEPQNLKDNTPLICLGPFVDRATNKCPSSYRRLRVRKDSFAVVLFWPVRRGTKMVIFAHLRQQINHHLITTLALFAPIFTPRSNTETDDRPKKRPNPFSVPHAKLLSFQVYLRSTVAGATNPHTLFRRNDPYHITRLIGALTLFILRYTE